MGWLRLVGSLKLQVSFAKEPYKRDVIVQKRPKCDIYEMWSIIDECDVYEMWCIIVW